MTRTAVDTATADSLIAARPYPPSWIDGLVRWIRQSRVPSWLFYVVLLATVALLSHAVLWLDGSLRAGSFTAARVADGGYGVFFLAFYHHLYLVARRSFRQFGPMLRAHDTELQALEYRLTTLPRRLGLLAALLGLALAVISIQSNPKSFGLAGSDTPWPSLFQYALVPFGFACMFALVMQSIRQLKLVNALHEQATAINLFRLGPAQALSNLTARTGIGLVIFIGYNKLVEGSNINSLNLVTLLVIGALAVIVFVVPLLGMRNRLSVEKARLVDEANERIQITIGQIHQHLDAGEHEAIGNLRTALGALTEERQLINGISTWPWQLSTVRGFASTLVLPIVIWLVTRLLARLI